MEWVANLDRDRVSASPTFGRTIVDVEKRSRTAWQPPTGTATRIRPLPAVGMAGGHARLVRVIFIDRVAQRAELRLHHIRMQEPARAMKRARGRAARVGYKHPRLSGLVSD
ncbi:hypothetical protein AUC69_08630 [Methyloceanibacter superfactus]|uniref:Uncharacterized protein n=1 Tax=Methyloceanibacter superfactus TaxID=1774969 RepID=A0A1E3W1I7_9HYPH|nr:hypothetical protein AUC69_08630 [Methyloceanibacter superfactus]